jgi:indolepyruvate ferredoxin oxidoreductase
MKSLRNTAFDPFGYTEERKTERRLIRDYEAALDEAVAMLNKNNARLVTDLASLPEKVRGFGHVKAANIAVFDKEREALLQRLRDARLAQAA